MSHNYLSCHGQIYFVFREKYNLNQGTKSTYLNQGTKTTYLNQGGGEKLPHTLKILENACIPMKLTQNDEINMKFWN